MHCNFLKLFHFRQTHGGQYYSFFQHGLTLLFNGVLFWRIPMWIGKIFFNISIQIFFHAFCELGHELGSFPQIFLHFQSLAEDVTSACNNYVGNGFLHLFHIPSMHSFCNNTMTKLSINLYFSWATSHTVLSMLPKRKWCALGYITAHCDRQRDCNSYNLRI